MAILEVMSDKTRILNRIENSKNSVLIDTGELLPLVFEELRARLWPFGKFAMIEVFTL